MFNYPESNARLVKSRIEAGEYPRYLYKYRVLQDKDQPGELQAFTHDLVANSRLWHPSPKDFNDPFDCHLTLNRIYNEAERKELVNNMNPNTSRTGRRQFLAKFKKHPKILLDTLERIIQNSMREIGVCCYGVAGDNILMWSHYGDSHKGVCFKFDLLANPGAYYDLFRVQYSKEYPVIKALNFDSMRDYLSTKSDIWAYEDEWRVFTRDGPGLKPFRKQGLIEIIFGCQAAAIPMATLSELVKQDPELQHVQLRQAHVDNHAYALRISNYTQP